MAKLGQITINRGKIPDAAKPTRQSSVDSIEGKKLGGHKTWFAFIDI